MSSHTTGSPRGSSRGKRAAERPPSRLRRQPKVKPPPPEPPAAEPPRAQPPPPRPPRTKPPRSNPPRSKPPRTKAPRPKPRYEPRPALRRAILLFWITMVLAGTAALLVAVVVNIFDENNTLNDLVSRPDRLAAAGSIAVVTSFSWLLATRTAGRALIAATLTLGLGVASVMVGGRILPTGAAVMTCAVGGVYAVMATVPAVTWWKSMREVLVATAITIVTALAAVGFGPTVSIERFDFTALLVALALAFSIVYRLGAGLHGLGRRGLILVTLGIGVLVLTLVYAELLRRYGSQGFVSSVLDFVDWTRARIGAFPRPLVVLLGIPALAWGTHVRARRRQGWWVCAFGVAATVPMAAGLVSPESSYMEAALRAGYSLALGLPIGYLVIRVDLALTGARGSRGRRAEEAGSHRPEPTRFAEL